MTKLKERKGYIRISRELYEKIDCRQLIFSWLLPYDMEWYPTGIGEICGVSEKFKKIKEGEPIPQYDVTFIRNEDGQYGVKVMEL